MPNGNEKQWKEFMRQQEEIAERQEEANRKANEAITGALDKSKQAFMEGFSSMSGIFRESFGAVFELADTGVNMLKGTWKILTGMFDAVRAVPGLFMSLFSSSREKKQVSLEEKQVGLLGSMTDKLSEMMAHFSWERKRAMRQDTTPGEGILGKLLGLGGIIAGGVLAFGQAFAGRLIKDATALVRPFFSILKGAFLGFGKIFAKMFRGISKIKGLQKLFSGMSKIWTKIRGWFATLGKWFGKIRGFFSGMVKKAGKFGKIAGKIGGLIGKIRGFFSGMVKRAGKFGRIAGKIGGLIGKIIMPILVVKEVLEGIFSEGTIRDKILSASAGVLSLFTQIPEWIGNAILSLFGADFRFDFGKQAIIDAVNSITDWTYKNITEPVLDFFTKTIPDTFSAFGDKFSEWIEKIKAFPSKIVDLFKGLIPSWEDIRRSIAGAIPEATPDFLIPDFLKKPAPQEEPEAAPQMRTGGIVKKGGMAQLHPAEVVVPQDLSKKLAGIMRTDRSREISKYENEKIKLYREINNNMAAMRQSYEDQARRSRSQESQRESQKSSAMQIQQPPDEVENFALLMFNKNWGLS